MSSAQRNETAVAQVLQFLSFTIGKEEYAVDIMKVREIRGWEETTALPNSLEYMRGVVNLRGAVVPIFDLKSRFGFGTTDVNRKNVVIVLAFGEHTIGILVETVSDILSARQDEIRPAPKGGTAIDVAYVQGIIPRDKKNMVILLDVEHLFDEKTLEAAAG
ncbi:MAG: purine-binding chemotaxis protein CheW [Hyphomicrobiales bacterium]|nr:purine-binding chemotaxis protein CheW [Hyphomicrobiales bacterium]